jgi:hypothetical protein
MIFQWFVIDEDRERVRSLHERPWVERRPGDRQRIDDRSPGLIDALDPFTDLSANRKWGIHHRGTEIAKRGRIRVLVIERITHYVNGTISGLRGQG